MNKVLVYLWGRKAFREGLPETANPYRKPEDRLAWSKGYHQERIESAQLQGNA